MTLEYTVTRQMAKEFQRDYISHLPERKRQTRWLVVASILLAAIYVSFEPASWRINNLDLSVILIVGVQIPICSVILFVILRLLFDAPIRAMVKAIDVTDDRLWGQRRLNIENNRVRLDTMMTSVAYDISLLDQILTTKTAHHLSSKGNLLISIPLQAIPRSDLLTAIRNNSSNHRLEVTVDPQGGSMEPQP